MGARDIANERSAHKPWKAPWEDLQDDARLGTWQPRSSPHPSAFRDLKAEESAELQRLLLRLFSFESWLCPFENLTSQFTHKISLNSYGTTS